MLVLTRYESESIIINDDIRIRVLRAGPNGQVRLGIDAPPDIAIDREEVYQRKQAEKLTEMHRKKQIDKLAKLNNLDKE